MEQPPPDRTRRTRKPTSYDRLTTSQKYRFSNLLLLNRRVRERNSAPRSADFNDHAPASWLTRNQSSRDLASEWQDELTGPKTAQGSPPSLLRAIWRAHGASFLFAMCFIAASDLVCEPAYFYLCIRLIEIIGSFVPETPPLAPGATTSHGLAGNHTGDLPTPSSPAELYWHAYLFLAAMVAYQLLSHPYAWLNHKMAVRMRVALSEMIYRKSLQIGCLDAEHGHEQALSLISRDLESLEVRFAELSWVFVGPAQCLIFTLILCSRLDVWTALVACLLSVVASFQRGLINFRLRKYSRLASEVADKRMHLVNETLEAIRLVRMYAWTGPLEAKIERNRAREVHYRKRHLAAKGVDIALFFVTSSVAALIALLFAHYVRGFPLTQSMVSQLFLVTSTYRRALSRYLANGVQTWAQSLVVIERCQRYLTARDKPATTTTEVAARNGCAGAGSPPAYPAGRHEPPSVCRLNNVSVVWSSAPGKADDGAPGQPTDKAAREFCVRQASLTARRGELVLVAGQVGSGKSSLLQVVLGELAPSSGSVSLAPTTKVAYASQKAWIFSGTVRENILLGLAFDLERYYEVLRVCALVPDLNIFPDFDRTRVGERGVTLSGGQKARINLARALYQRADLYLLDDPLSAVDGHVSSHIFSEALRGFLAKQTVILVTHQTQYLRRVDKILYLGRREAGSQRTNFFGTYAELERSHLLDELLACSQSAAGEGKDKKPASAGPARDEQSPATSRDWVLGRILSNQLDESVRPGSTSVSPDYNQNDMHEILESRQRNRGRVKTSKVGRATWFYFRSAGSHWAVMAFAVVNIMLRCVFLSVNIFLNFWAGYQIWSAPDDGSTPVLVGNKLGQRDDQLNWFSRWLVSLDFGGALAVSGFLVLVITALAGLRTVQFYTLNYRASERVHRRLIRSLLWTRLGFFDITPQGHLVNRLAADVAYMDSQIPYQIDQLSITGLSVAFIFVGIVCSQTKLALVVCLMSLALHRLFKYLADLMEVIKYLDGFRRSNLYSHVFATLEGLPTVRSSNQGWAFEERFNHLLDQHTSVRFLSISAKRFIIGVVDWMLVAFYFFLVVFTVHDTLRGHGLLAFVGLNLVVNLTRIAQNTLVVFVEFYLSVQSMDRLREYSTELEHEKVHLCKPYVDMGQAHEPRATSKADLLQLAALGQAHFARGAIKFSGVSLKFALAGKLVLDNVSFAIEPGTKVGVIGRTGAGKSSLITVLFHLYHFEGLVHIDGQDTKELELESLRKSISIIPQDPCLFTGSVRHNLDPFGEHSDEKLWRALEAVQLKPLVEAHPAKLEMPVHKSGANFSIGQRQLVCLARAILKDNKILVMDEATSNVDQETDALIQLAIKSEFGHCTVLTIAHRLSTVVQLDKLMVMQDGRLVEFGTPQELLDRGPDGSLCALIESSGEQQAAVLRGQITGSDILLE